MIAAGDGLHRADLSTLTPGEAGVRAAGRNQGCELRLSNKRERRGAGEVKQRELPAAEPESETHDRR